MSLAKITVLGNIGQDAQVREVNGRYAINFSIAHNRKWTDNDGVISTLSFILMYFLA
jgi:single-stranded DNA-binding protein